MQVTLLVKLCILMAAWRYFKLITIRKKLDAQRMLTNFFYIFIFFLFSGCSQFIPFCPEEKLIPVQHQKRYEQDAGQMRMQHEKLQKKQKEVFPLGLDKVKQKTN